MIWNYLLPVLALILTLLVWIRYYRYPHGKLPKWLFLTGILVASSICGATIYSIKLEEDRQRYDEYSGVISGKLENESIVYPSIKLGTANFVWQGPEEEPMFKIGNDSIRVWIVNRELKISTVIRDESGKIIARIEANEWQVNPNLIFDRNFDETAVEVINEKGEVVLQAKYDGESVLFAGIFYREDGSRVALGYNVIEIRPPGEPLQTSFSPIFKYPSSSHPGERR